MRDPPAFTRRPLLVRPPLLLAALLAAAPSHAEDPCAAEAVRLCQGATQTRPGPRSGPGKGGAFEVMGCLRANESKLSPACREWLAAALRKGEQVAAGCEGDARKLCADVEPGDGRVAACLVRNQSQLSQGCQGALNEVRLKTTQIQAACAAEIGRLCPDVEMGGGRVVACLEAHDAELSSDCRSAVSRW